ncbi:MAG: 2-oxo acid dehydrogenase subunit E2, partial [Pseudomonadota bacterium]
MGDVPTDTTIPLRGMRGMIADKMSESLATAAQLTHQATADASKLMARKAELTGQGTKVSVEDLVLEAVVRAIGTHPEINGTVVDREVRLSSEIDLGVAIALDGGLLVAPAMFDCGGKDAAALRELRQDLVARAKVNKLSVKEMTSGTFTVSNLGLTRVEHFTPIINVPQIAILGV